MSIIDQAFNYYHANFSLTMPFNQLFAPDVEMRHAWVTGGFQEKATRVKGIEQVSKFFKNLSLKRHLIVTCILFRLKSAATQFK